MSGNTIVGKVFEGRTIDRVVELDNGLIEIGFTDNTFERVHSNDFADFAASLVGAEADMIPLADLTKEETVLGFYKTLEPISYTDEKGNELGKTEVGSIQEVPVALGDMWVAEGWAEKVTNETEVTE